MSERITAITEVRSAEDWGDSEGNGYDVVTTERTIRIRIDNTQNCCESWGSMSTPDDPSQFIGSDLLSVSTVVDNGCAHERDNDYCGDEENTVFVNIETSLGQLQLAVYNRHNGYYGHWVKVTSEPPLDGATYQGGV